MIFRREVHDVKLKALRWRSSRILQEGELKPRAGQRLV